MTASRDPDRLIHAFLREGDEELDDRVYDVVRAAIEQRRQRAVFGLWSTPIMNKYIGIGLGAAAVVVILLLGAQFLGEPTNVGGPPADATPSAPDPTPTSTPDAFVPEPFEFAWPEMPDRAPRITVTIPAAGWTELDPGILAKGDDVDNLPEAAFIVFTEAPGARFYVYGDPCRLMTTRPETPATTVDEIVAALAAQASRDASEPVDVTVDGYSGKTITLHVPPDANPDECEAGEFASFGIETEDLARYHQGPGQVDELWVIDVDGSIVIIDAMYRPDTSAELIAEMRSIAESATFELP